MKSKLLEIDFEKRNIGLDVMRSLAIIIVLFGHLINIFIEHLYTVIPYTNLSLKRFFFYFVTGFDGVDLFFVLSGFLIGNSILSTYKSEKLSLKYLITSFWIKRWLRTLPNYFVVLILLILINKWFFMTNDSDINNNYIGYFVFYQNILSGELHFFPESWSLSVEEWFYITFPLVLTLINYLSNNFSVRKWLLLITIITFIIGGLFFRINYNLSSNFNSIGITCWNRDIRTSVLMRIDAIIYGVLFAFLNIYYSDYLKNLRYVFAFFGSMILAYSFDRFFLNTNKLDAVIFSHSLYFSFVGIGFAMWIPFFNYLRINSVFLIKVFTLISVLSYSFYLINFSLIQNIILRILENNSLILCFVKFLFCVISTFFVSLVLYKFVELPFMKLRKKIIYE